MNKYTDKYVMTKEEGKRLLKQDIQTAKNAVNKNIKVQINEDMDIALTSLAYNIGAGAFARSSVVSYLNAKKYPEAEQAFMKWVTAGGKTLDVLVKRRSKEAALFRQGYQKLLGGQSDVEIQEYHKDIYTSSAYLGFLGSPPIDLIDSVDRTAWYLLKDYYSHTNRDEYIRQYIHRPIATLKDVAEFLGAKIIGDELSQNVYKPFRSGQTINLPNKDKQEITLPDDVTTISKIQRKLQLRRAFTNKTK